MMFNTPTIVNPEVKADAARENVADMIIGYVIEQLNATPISTSEDLDDLVQKTRTWLIDNPHPTITELSDLACDLVWEFTG